MYPDLFNPDGSAIYNTDWQDESTRSAQTQRHSISIGGGTEKSTTGLSLGYQDVDGILLETFHQKYNVGLNNEVKITPWLDLSTTVLYSYTRQNRIDDHGVGANVATRTMTEFLPMLPVQYENGTYSRLTDFLNMFPVENPVRVLRELNKISTDNQLLGNLALKVKFNDALSFKTTFGVESRNYNLDFYSGRDLLDLSASQRGSATRSNQRILFWQTENFLNYNKAFGNHNVDAIIGASWSKHVDQSFTTTVTGFSDDAFQFNNLGAGTVFNAGSGYVGWKLNSYYGRVNYSYADKYLLTATGRYDGSSKFGKENRYAFFPSAAIGWRISNEEFLNSSRLVSDLKLRFSSGITGNSEIGPYAAQGTTGNYTVIFNESRNTGIAEGPFEAANTNSDPSTADLASKSQNSQAIVAHASHPWRGRRGPDRGRGLVGSGRRTRAEGRLSRPSAPRPGTRPRHPGPRPCRSAAWRRRLPCRNPRRCRHWP